MRILLIEPYFTGSHKTWAEGFCDHSSHEITLMTMSGHHWKWRMHGAAITLARRYLEINSDFDLILVSDMLDLTTFQALTREKSHDIPFAIYFHENQLSYPASSRDSDHIAKRDNHYAFINITSALAADHCFFNSEYNRRDFLDQLEPFLNAFPDHNEKNARFRIERKSSVLHLGMDLSAFDPYEEEKEVEPIILWNHRWEHDKNPELFFKSLFELAEREIPFRMAILGEQFSESPVIFEQAKSQLADRILHWGQVHDFSEYAKWLWKSTVIPVTSNQDFFGSSTVEAIYCNCIPLLPNRLAFPDHIPESLQNELLFENDNLTEKLTGILMDIPYHYTSRLRPGVSDYDWKNMVSIYDERLEKVKGHPDGQPF